MSRLLPLGLAVLLGALLVTSAFAATPAPSKRAATKSKAAATHHATKPAATKAAPQPVAQSEVLTPVPNIAGTAALRAYLDPETGTITTIRPIGFEQVQIDPLNDSDEGLVQQVLPNGSVMIDLQGRYQEYMVVRLDANGRRVFQCEKNPAVLKQLLSTPAPTPYAER